jgi:hypothetical protein
MLELGHIDKEPNAAGKSAKLLALHSIWRKKQLGDDHEESSTG